MYISAEDYLFAKRTLSDFVNGQMHDPKVVAAQMGRDHRYLQSEMFKVCYEYIRVLAINYQNGRFDPRNEWACKTANEIVNSVDSIPDITQREIEALNELNTQLYYRQ